MTETNKPETIPLTEEEKSHLLTIYNTRMRIFIAAFGFMIVEGSYAALRGYKPKVADSYDYEIFSYKLIGMELFLVMLVFIHGMIFYFGFRVFFKKVHCFKKDANYGHKEVVYKTITDKKHFPATGQYFISFDDPDYMHHEVDADFYYAVEEGGTVSLFRGLYSKHVFQKDGRFTLM